MPACECCEIGEAAHTGWYGIGICDRCYTSNIGYVSKVIMRLKIYLSRTVRKLKTRTEELEAARRATTMKWTKERPTKDGWYFVTVQTPGGRLIEVVVHVYCSTPRGKLPYLGQPTNEEGKTFPEHDLPADRVSWDGCQFRLYDPIFKKFAGPITPPEGDEQGQPALETNCKE